MQITYERYQQIQQLKAQGKYQWQVAQELKCGLSTVRRYWYLSLESFYARLSKKGINAMDRYKQQIVNCLEDDPNLSNKDIYQQLLASEVDFSIKQRSVMEYLYFIRREYGFNYATGKRHLQKQEDRAPGEESQVDLGQINITSIYGRLVKIYIFAMVLSNSRMMFCTLRTEPYDAAAFVDAHKLAFNYFGGRTNTIMYDQDRVMVVSENAGNIIFTKAFEQFKDQAGFNIYLCHKSDPSTKGKIETAIRYIKYNFFKGRKFTSLVSLNDDLLKWLDQVANKRVHYTTMKQPCQVYVEKEKQLLTPYIEVADTFIRYRTTKVSHLHTVKYLTNEYSVPKGRYLVGTTVKLACVADVLKIYDIQTDELIVQHSVINARGNASILAEKRWQYDKMVKETLDILHNSALAIDLLEHIQEQMPRYVREQCYMLRRISNTYDSSVVDNAIALAIQHNIYDATHVLAILVNQEGIAKAKDNKVLPIRTAPTYLQKAKQLSQYDNLSKGGGNNEQ